MDIDSDLTQDAKAVTLLHYTTGATEFDTSARAIAFGRLADLAAPIVVAYRSDLYHDALWLDKFMRGSDLTFYYAIRGSGTTIGTEEIYMPGDARYRVRVWVEPTGGATRMNIEPR